MTGKKKNKSSNTEANSSKLWPHLPKQLIYLIERQPSLCEAIFYRGVTKSWKVTPNKCNSNSTLPWLQYTIDDHEIGDSNKEPHTYNITFKTDCKWYYNLGYRGSFPRDEFHVLGCCQGILVFKSYCNEVGIQDTSNKKMCLLPLWDTKDPLIYTSSSCSPVYENKCVLIVLTGISRPAFAFYRMQGEPKGWIKKNSIIVDPHCSDPNERGNLLRFTNGIWFKEKFYALSLQGTLAVIQDIGTDLIITDLSNKRAVPSVSSMHFRECLIESKGKILLVLLVSINSINTVDCLEVYQLNTAKLTWTKRDSLGDVTLFLNTSNCCMSVSASRVGCRENCICFTHSNTDGWWIYDMETTTISSLNKSSSFWIEQVLLD